MRLVQKVKDMGAAATTSMISIPKLLHYLAKVLIQDSLVLAEKYPQNPVHEYLLGHPVFE